MIEAQELVKVFHDKKRGEVRAVDGVSFQCKPGQIYGLLGANGAGKTTTLRMLATILEPTDGTAIVAGYDVVTAPDQLEKVKTALAAKGLECASAELVRLPKTTVPLDGKAAEQMVRLMEALEEHDDVQRVWANFDISEKLLETLVAA